MKVLSKRHRRQLVQESGIAPEVVDQRGYRSVRSRAELMEASGRYIAASLELPFPGIYIPILPSPLVAETASQGEEGKTTPFLYRPDDQWTPRDGSERGRYVNPPRQRNYLDVHPANVDALVNTTRTVLITEGTKKADAATSRGLLTVGLSGVFNWKYKPRADGRRPSRDDPSLPCPEWDHFPLRRKFVIAFDSDVITNPEVAAARDRLARFLYARGATRVSWARLPPGPNGAKNGLDDWFVAGGSVADLKALCRRVSDRVGARV